MPSTVISKAIYDEVSNTLRVIYVSGMIYDYKEVPKEVYDEMKIIGSKGRYLNLKIKGRYPFEKINQQKNRLLKKPAFFINR